MRQSWYLLHDSVLVLSLAKSSLVHPIGSFLLSETVVRRIEKPRLNLFWKWPMRNLDSATSDGTLAC